MLDGLNVIVKDLSFLSAMNAPLRFLFLIPFILFYECGNAQSSMDTARETNELVAKYLSDTLNAATKINELVDEAINRAGPIDLSERVLRFQLALALAPYAQDSARILSRLNAQFSSWLFNAGATDLAVQYAKTGLAYGRKAFTNKSVG